ncbi:MAG: hypothetical protein FD123_3008 [Bacteroidetes bacterium]|nr:MAG: hypothetical protein FD123_3008 [Bacteroidota bacterium]
MIRNIFLALYLLFSLSASAIIDVGPLSDKEVAAMESKKELLFITGVKLNDIPWEQYDSVLKKLDKYEHVTIISADQKEDYLREDKGNKYLILEGTLGEGRYTSQGKSGSTVNKFTLEYLELYFFNDNKKVSAGVIYLQRYRLLNKHMSPGVLHVMLTSLIDMALQKKKLNPADKYEADEALAGLKNETLYIPDYCLAETDWKNSGLLTGKLNDAQTILKDYSFQYKVVTAEELEKLLAAKKVKYFMTNGYTMYPGYVFVSIYDVKNSSLIYSRSALAYHMQAGGVKRLVSAIKKTE